MKSRENKHPNITTKANSKQMAAMEQRELKFLISMPVIKFKVFESLGNITNLNMYSGIDIN